MYKTSGRSISLRANLNLVIDRTKRSNNFDFLRFVAATLVVFSHCYPLTGINEQEPLALLNGHTFGWFAVVIFFIISGYLICKSYSERPNPIRFMWNRSLRIFPGLFFSLIITVLIIGSLVTNLSLSEYFTTSGTWEYFFNITLYFMHNTLPGVFENNLYPDAVNGSLWTLSYEFSMYLVILLLGIIGLLKRKASVILIAAFYLIASSLLIPDYWTRVIFGQDVKYFLELGFYFLLGAIFYLYRDFIVLNVPIALSLLTIWLLSFPTSFFIYVSYIAIPYLVLFFAFLPIPYLNNFAKFGDFSYGLYIFAFPIQQSIIFVSNGKTSILALFGISMLITLIAAIISWHFIESKALKLKKEDPSEVLYKIIARFR